MSTPTAKPLAFSLPEQQAVYRAIFERRDMRHFSGGVVPDDVLQRVYEQPMLQQEKWARREALSSLVFDDLWGQTTTLPLDGGTAP